MKKYLLSSMLLALFAIGFTASDQTDLPEKSNVVYDASKPTIQILSPSSEGSFVTTESSVVISGIAQDDNSLASVTFKSSSGTIGTAEGLEEWSISGLELVEGDNIIEVTATDDNNNSTTASITITKNQSVSFLDVPAVDNGVLYAGTPSTVWITVGIVPNEKLISSSVTLVEVDEDNNVISEICSLYDDGNLEHGDEIKGDNVFSTKYTFNYQTVANHKFRVGAKTNEDSGEVVGYSSVFTLYVIDQQEAKQQVENLMNFQDQAESKLQEIADLNMSPEQEEAAIVEWLNTQSAVSSVTKEGSLVRIDFANGLTSYLMIDKNNGGKGNGKGNSLTSADRYKTPAIPLNLQTRGTWSPSTTRAASVSPFKKAPAANNTNIIQNKNVLIWAPFENSFPQDMGPALKPIFENSQVGFHIDYLTNDECTTESLKNLANYGVVVIDSHGLMGNLILTREKAGTFAELIGATVYNDYIYQYVSGSYYLVTMEYYREDLQKKIVETFYAITPKFIKNKVKGTLPNSIIFNGSCESLQTDNLSSAFIAKGAKTYLGFKETVLTNTCINKAVQFFSSLVGDELKTTGDSYVSDIDFTEDDGTDTWLNSYLMAGSKEMRFHLGLINGDFEYRNLNGWNVSGDGRVITQLGPLTPPQGTCMGIISTGLGYTTDYGSIWQTFNVTNETTLSIKWNFLSEEFLEWVGSQYQDYLKITIISDEQREVIYLSAIDAFVNNYPVASNYVSPEIVFDRNGVYMTGWQVSTFDITQYQGKTITLLIESGDVGDSIFDSATLLDEIQVY